MHKEKENYEINNKCSEKQRIKTRREKEIKEETRQKNRK
jgi:hypothetical protein